MKKSLKIGPGRWCPLGNFTDDENIVLRHPAGPVCRKKGPPDPGGAYPRRKIGDPRTAESDPRVSYGLLPRRFISAGPATATLSGFQF